MKFNWKKVLGFLIVLALIGFGVVDPADLFVSQTPVPTHYLENREIEVAACNLSGEREANVKVDIGFAERKYYAYTNNSAQLIYVTADYVALQRDDELAEGKKRYCYDEAKVPGTEAKDKDEGHILADSLGGVANAYNITPQDSYTNRNGAQAEMERFMRDILKKGGEITNFQAFIEYPDETTHTPDFYTYEMYANGEFKQYAFSN